MRFKKQEVGSFFLLPASSFLFPSLHMIQKLHYKNVRWVNIVKPEEKDIEMLRQNYPFHPLDLEDTICPVCDTEFAAVESPVQDDDIKIMTEEDELSGLGLEEELLPDDDLIEELDIEAEPEMEGAELAEEIAATDPIEPEEPVDEATVPEEGADSVECPSCGADVEAGTAACPVCEYPLE